MRIALYQGSAEPLDPQHNLGLIDRAASEAADGGAELLITPELFATGYTPSLIRSRLSRQQVAEAAGQLADTARRHRIGLVHSLPGEESADRRGITACLLAPSGEPLAHYQKVQLFGPEEKAAFTPGSAPPPVVEYGGMRVGLLVCYDVEFPELVRAPAVAGADLIVVPTALAVGSEEVTRTLVPARALENRLTVAYANHTGTQLGLRFDGGSVVAGPLGELSTAGTEPQLLFVDVGSAPEPGPAGPWYLQDRRAEVYREWMVDAQAATSDPSSSPRSTTGEKDP